MDEKIKLRVWKEIAKTTIENYLVSLFVSQEDEEFRKDNKKFKINDLRKKIKNDKILMKNSYDEKIGEENINKIITNLDCLLEFLESSSDMISLSCKSLIECTGRSFNFEYAEILINLRNDFDNEEKKSALELCKEVIDNYKEDSNEKVTRHLFEYVNQKIEIKKNSNKKNMLSTSNTVKSIKIEEKKSDLAEFGIDLSDEDEIENENENNNFDQEKNDDDKTANENFFVPSAINHSVNVDIIMEDTMQKKSYEM